MNIIVEAFITTLVVVMLGVTLANVIIKLYRNYGKD